MGLKFKKSVKICKGVRMNFSGSGVGLSVGSRGCRYSLHSSGRRTATIGIPGTGFSYSSSTGSRKRKSSSKHRSASTRSYNSAAYKKREEIQRQKAIIEKQKQDELRLNQLKVQEFENYIEVIQNVHRECEASVDWNVAFNVEPPYVYGMKGPKEIAAESRYENFKPNVFEKLTKNKGEKRKQRLFDGIAIEKVKDEEDYQAWQEGHTFAERILNGDIDAYLEAINESNPFEDFSDYGSDFEFGTDNPNYIEIEFKVKSTEVVPKNVISLTKTGKLSEKAMTKTMYYDITQDYVCSCAIRLAREMFAMLPIKNVLVHAVDTIIDTTTGNDVDTTILSINFNRTGFEDINFDKIDASDFVGTFECKMKFAKTAGFKTVERLSY